jgi:hypothetical protein
VVGSGTCSRSILSQPTQRLWTARSQPSVDQCHQRSDVASRPRVRVVAEAVGDHAGVLVGGDDALFDGQKQLTPVPPAAFGDQGEGRYVQSAVAAPGFGQDGVLMVAARIGAGFSRPPSAGSAPNRHVPGAVVDGEPRHHNGRRDDALAGVPGGVGARRRHRGPTRQTWRRELCPGPPALTMGAKTSAIQGNRRNHRRRLHVRIGPTHWWKEGCS